jgi:threonine dehydratase
MNLVSPTDLTLDAAMVRATRERTQSMVITTPTLHRPALSQLLGCEVFIKYENMQHTGAFKARGAIAKLTTLTDAQKKAGVIAVSAGNHAQGVAFHATRLGIPATIVMPKGTPFNKTRKTSDYGGKVVLEGENFTEATAACLRIAKEKGLTLIHPYDDAYVVSGQGVIGFEMLEAVPDLDVIIVPVGGGGLIAGIALAASERRPRLRIIGVQSESASAFAESFRAGHVTERSAATIADGIAVRRPAERTLAIVSKHVDDVITVSDQAIARAIVVLLERTKMLAEGAGAAGIAAVLEANGRVGGQKVGVIVSGGNIDPNLLGKALQQGLASAGRYLAFRTWLDDRPGMLHELTGILTAERINILHIGIHRLGPYAAIGRVGLDVIVDTRDRAHADAVLAMIRGKGFPAEELLDTSAP